MVRKTIKQAVKALDFFAKPVAFRYGDQPEYQSLTGGFCSITLIIIFAIIFTNTVLSTFNRVNIDHKETEIQQQDPTLYRVGTDNFMFAVGVSGIDLNQGKQWFEIYFQQRIYANNQKIKIKFNFTKCSKQQWTRIKPEFLSVYDKLGFDAWLCPTDNTILELQGKYSSEVFKFYKIGVKQCSSAVETSTRPCATAADITQYINQNEAFTFNFYFVNTILNAGNKEHISTYLDDTNYFPFSPNNGMSINFFMSSYNISTDESILPWESKKQENGGIQNVPAQTINYQVKQKEYLKFYIRKSSLSLVIDRSFRKIDDTLSYIGGLFSTIVVALFIVGKYNQLSYELEIAKNLYHYDKNEPLISDEFNFIAFIGYLVYLLFSLVNVELPWKKMKIYKRSLEQVRKQMDVRLVMKKVLYAERMAIAVFDQSKAKILHLQEPLTLEQAELIRKDHRFYEKLEKKYFDYKKIKEEESNQNMQNNDSKVSIEEELQPKKQISQTSIKLELKKGQESQCEKKIEKSTLQRKLKSVKVFRTRNNLLERYKRQKKKQEQKKLKKNTLNILNMLISKDQRRQNELNEMIQQMVMHVKILQQEADDGDIVSEKILSRFDDKLLRMFVLSDQGSQKKQSTQQMQQIAPSNYFINLQVSPNKIGDSNKKIQQPNINE